LAVDALRGATMLVVDDDGFHLAVTCHMLASAGVTIRTAVNGADALRALRSGRFDAVLMDVQMPVLDGLEATRQIRADAALSDTLVLGFTANASGADREKCMQAGMNDVLRKPAEPPLLLGTLALWMENRRLGRTAAPETSPPES
jgi:CheY-like chemotaxis protein